MKKEINKTAKFNQIIIYLSFLLALVVIDIIFLFLITNDIKTLALITQERTSLKNQEKIISTASTITANYQDEIQAISDVFPNEETIPVFIQSLENLIKTNTDEYTFKFSSLMPLKEGDKMYLLMSITMKADYYRLLEFLSQLEHLPYMTHIISINAKTPAGFEKEGEYSIGLKIYVQNPFTVQ